MNIPYEQLEGRGIHDPEVLRVVRDVRREEFVPEGLRASAYEDRPLSIGFKATISQPYMVAAMTELLQIERHHRVLEVGTGSGYQAAVLSRLAAEVYSVEVVPELAVSAAETLHRLGYLNVHVRHGDGYEGWMQAAPFDRVLLTAAPPRIPEKLMHQLQPGGKLVSPEGKGDDQYLFVLDKSLEGRIHRREIFPVLFVPMVPGGGDPGVL